MNDGSNPDGRLARMIYARTSPRRVPHSLPVRFSNCPANVALSIEPRANNLVSPLFNKRQHCTLLSIVLERTISKANRRKKRKENEKEGETEEGTKGEREWWRPSPQHLSFSAFREWGEQRLISGRLNRGDVRCTPFEPAAGKIEFTGAHSVFMENISGVSLRRLASNGRAWNRAKSPNNFPTKANFLPSYKSAMDGSSFDRCLESLNSCSKKEWTR